jgi:hypothetical protein
VSRIVAGFDGSQCRSGRHQKQDRIGYWIQGPGVNIQVTKRLPRGSRTVDQVEMTALRCLCETLSQMGIPDAIIQGDSKRVIDKIILQEKTGSPLLKRCQQYFLDNPRWIVFWVGREHNSFADAIAKNAFS